MLFTSSDEEAGALIEKYKKYSRDYEKNLLMLNIKTDGHLSISEIYNMTHKMREIYIEASNEFIEEQNKKMKS